MFRTGTISIIIPFYKGEHLIQTLIESLRSAISRVKNSDIRFEIIIVIDSPDSCLLMLKEQLQTALGSLDSISLVIRQNEINLGVAASRNLALSIATGDFIHIIDQDDQIADTFYSEVVPLLERYNFILVNGRVEYEKASYKTHLIYYFRPKLTLKSLILDDFIRSPGQVVFSKEMANKLSFPVTINFKGADDKFFWVTMFFRHLRSIKPFFLRSPLYIAYIHSSNFSADNQNLQLSCLENWDILNKQLDFEGYKMYVDRNINYLSFITSTSDSFAQKLWGFGEWLIYAANLNRIVRYIIKRR